MDSGHSIRLAALEDEPLVSELLEASYPVLMATNYDSYILEAALPRMTRANPSLLKSGSFYVEETIDRRIIGCGGWSFDRPGTKKLQPGLAHIRHFATHPQWLRIGIGRAIYKRCEHDAILAGANEFECFASLNAIGFYESLGFHTKGRTHVAMGPEVVLPVALMRRTI